MGLVLILVYGTLLFVALWAALGLWCHRLATEYAEARGAEVTAWWPVKASPAGGLAALLRIDEELILLNLSGAAVWKRENYREGLNVRLEQTIELPGGLELYFPGAAEDPLLLKAFRRKELARTLRLSAEEAQRELH